VGARGARRRRAASAAKWRSAKVEALGLKGHSFSLKGSLVKGGHESRTKNVSTFPQVGNNLGKSPGARHRRKLVARGAHGDWQSCHSPTGTSESNTDGRHLRPGVPRFSSRRSRSRRSWFRGAVLARATHTRSTSWRPFARVAAGEVQASRRLADKRDAGGRGSPTAVVTACTTRGARADRVGVAFGWCLRGHLPKGQPAVRAAGALAPCPLRLAWPLARETSADASSGRTVHGFGLVQLALAELARSGVVRRNNVARLRSRRELRVAAGNCLQPLGHLSMPQASVARLSARYERFRRSRGSCSRIVVDCRSRRAVLGPGRKTAGSSVCRLMPSRAWSERA